MAAGASQLRITLAEFYAHRLMVRIPASSPYVELPHAAGRLFQQYIVDAYGKLETSRLEWVTRNQDKLRMDTLQGLCDHVAGLDYTAAAPRSQTSHDKENAPILRALGVAAPAAVRQHRHACKPHTPADAAF